MDPIERLADIVVKTNYEDIPENGREAVKRCFIDTLGVLIAGSSAEGCQIIADLVKEWGGKKESTIMVYGGRVPSPNAVWANALMARALDFDDVYTGPSGDHTSAITVTTALAMAELLGKTNGKEVITAIALGTDVVLRLRSVCQLKLGASPWPVSSTAVFTAAAVAGKLLKLDKVKMVDALGIALTQASGTLQSVQDGALSHRVHPGLMTRAGLSSALMAKKGITGARNVLEGRYGFYPVFFQNQYDRQALIAGLERGFLNLICDVSIKAYPGCVLNHPSIEATLRLVKEHGIRPTDIAEITVYTNQVAYDIVYRPEERKKRPQTIVDGQFSIPYNVATTLIYHDVFIDAFSEERIRDPEVLRIASKVKVVVDPVLDAGRETLAPHRMEIRTLDGKAYATTIQHIKGHPQNPMSIEDCIQKFRRCLAFSARRLPKQSVEQVVDMARELEKVDDVGRIPQLLVGKEF